MLSIRKEINNNKYYAWMLVMILLIQSYAIAMHKSSVPEEITLKKTDDFAQVLDANRKLVEKSILKNPEIATWASLISLLIMAVLILGVIFLINFLIQLYRGNNMIARTAKNYPVAWNWTDILRIVIAFVFINHISYLCQEILTISLNIEHIDNKASMIVDTMFMHIFALLMVVYFVTVKYKQKITALGISLKGIFKNIGIALYSYIAFLPILATVFIGLLILIKFLNYTPPRQPIYELIFEEQRTHFLIVISVMVALIGPIAEEVFFRGFFYTALKKRFNIITAMIISAGIFSLLHNSVVGFLPILMLGMFLAYLREKTGSLIPCITVHVIHNATLASLMFFTRYVMELAV